MKFISTWLTIILFSQTILWGKGIEFFQGTLAEAKEIAGQQGKLIFVDAFTTWCGPCKRMSANVFTQEEVGDFYNSTFINMKLDMEKGDGKTFQKQYQVNAFPTLLFLDPEGKVVHKVVGGMDTKNFINLGKFAASKSSVSSSLDKEYEEGRRDPAFMAKYIEALSTSNRPLLKVANEYFSGQQNLSSPDNLRIIYFSLVEVDSRIFNLMVEKRKDIVGIFGEDAVEKQIIKAADVTLKKAIEFENSDLMEEAIEKVKRYATNHYKQFQYSARLKYYSETRQPEMYLRYARDYVRIAPEQKFELANNILHNMKDQPDLMRQATIWAVEAAEDAENEHHYFVAAQLLFIDGQYQKSRPFAEQAFKLASDSNSGAAPHIKRLLSAIEQKIGLNKS